MSSDIAVLEVHVDAVMMLQSLLRELKLRSVDEFFRSNSFAHRNAKRYEFVERMRQRGNLKI